MTAHEKIQSLTDTQLNELMSYTLGLRMSRANKNRALAMIEGEINSRAFLRACKQ